jgi:ABC-2 type transport system permease protein
MTADVAPATAPPALAPGGRDARGSALIGTGQMVRLALRRDRFLVPSWVLVIAGMASFSAQATVGLYPDLPQRIEAAEAINGSAALIALYGRIYDPTSLGELSLFKMTAFGAAMVGVLMIMLVVRHTRAEEEAGRLELVGATVVGRAAPLAAGLLLAATASAGIVVLTAAGLALAGLPPAGAVAFGAAWGATGVLFAAVGAIAAQLSVGARSATGLGLIALAVAYVARAVGDLAEGGPGWLSWLSPIGWSQQVRAFSGTRWGMLVLPVIATAVLVAVAFLLQRRRDLGAGLLADRPGPAEGRIGSTWGLSWRLQRPGFLAWSVAGVLMGVVLGSVADSVSGFIDTPAMAQFLERLGGRQGIVDMFLAAELGIIGSLIAAYGIVAASWLQSEEEGGRTENVLATARSRRQWASSHAVLALACSAALMVLVGLAIGLGHALSVGEPEQVWRLGMAATTRIPASWVMVGLAVAIWGFWPRLTGIAWVLFVAFLVMGEFGVLWDIPEWVRNLSPFAHSPVVPGPDPQYLGVPVMVGISVGLVALGVARFARRDVVNG